MALVRPQCFFHHSDNLACLHRYQKWLSRATRTADENATRRNVWFNDIIFGHFWTPTLRAPWGWETTCKDLMLLCSLHIPIWLFFRKPSTDTRTFYRRVSLDQWIGPSRMCGVPIIISHFGGTNNIFINALFYYQLWPIQCSSPILDNFNLMQVNSKICIIEVYLLKYYF